jgi:hypothetical protein
MVSRELEVMSNRLASVIETGPIFSSSFGGGSTFPASLKNSPSGVELVHTTAPASRLLSIAGVAVEKLFFKKFAKTTLRHASI